MLQSFPFQSTRPRSVVPLLSLILHLLQAIGLEPHASYGLSTEDGGGRGGVVVLNDRPIIGILAQEYFHEVGPAPAPALHAYIAASYVKWVESAGGRVVALMINQPDSDYLDLMGKLNGILFPGGGVALDERSGYGRAARIIWDEVLRRNSPTADSPEGEYYPLWGTCLGMEEIVFQATRNVTPPSSGSWLSNCHAEDLALPLNFTSHVTQSRLFGPLANASASRSSSSTGFDLLKVMASENVTANYHSKCLSRKDFFHSGMNSTFDLLATNLDRDGRVEFVSAFEHRSAPIYAVQFHPEKNVFEFVQGVGLRHTPHSPNAIQVAQYFANFFVGECRKNGNTFNSSVAESDALIYNYNPVQETAPKQHFNQIYLFPIA